MKNLQTRLLILSIFINSVSFAQSSQLQSRINQLAKDPALKHASLGISIIDVETGKTIAAYQSNKSLIPASILKLLTTSTAVGILGNDYRFKTELQYSGKIDASGNLNGNLYIKGFGDPTLGSPLMEKALDLDELMAVFQKAILKKNIQCIKGQIVGDASWFESDVNAPDWPWVDLGNYYAAGIWGLNMHENLYYLRFLQNPKLKATPRIQSIEPEIEDLLFYNEIKSAAKGSGDNAYIYGAPYANERYVRGTIPIGTGVFSIKGSMPDPPLFAANYLLKSLEQSNVSVQKGITTTKLTPLSLKEKRKVIYTHQSPTLKEIIHRTNLKSVNLYCETMLRQIGKVKMQEGSTSKGIESIQNFWKDRGLSFNGVNLTDGSGLSRTNVVTTHFMTMLLRKITKDPKLYKTIYNSLPIAGKSGGIKYYLRGTAAQGNLRAKTGTLGKVRSFAGYASTKTGKKLAFCIIVNNFSGSGGALRKKLAPVMKGMCE